jgi:hypothetical protein
MIQILSITIPITSSYHITTLSLIHHPHSFCPFSCFRSCCVRAHTETHLVHFWVFRGGHLWPCHLWYLPPQSSHIPYIDRSGAMRQSPTPPLWFWMSYTASNDAWGAVQAHLFRKGILNHCNIQYNTSTPKHFRIQQLTMTRSRDQPPQSSHIPYIDIDSHTFLTFTTTIHLLYPHSSSHCPDCGSTRLLFAHPLWYKCNADFICKISVLRRHYLHPILSSLFQMASGLPIYTIY